MARARYENLTKEELVVEVIKLSKRMKRLINIEEDKASLYRNYRELVIESNDYKKGSLIQIDRLLTEVKGLRYELGWANETIKLFVEDNPQMFTVPVENSVVSK